jgi:AraC-like DNA-binding protein
MRPSLLPTYAIDTFDLPADRSRDIWQNIVDGTFEVVGPLAPNRGHRVRTQVWFLEQLMLATFKAEANIVERTEALVSGNPAPVVKIRLYQSGQSQLVYGDDRWTIGPGAIHFIDHDRPHRQISTDHEQITLSVPYHVIGYDPARYAACFSIGSATPRGQVLHAALRAAFDAIANVSLAEASGLAAALAGLLRGTLAGGVEGRHDENARQARIAAIKRHVDENLADPDFDIAALLREVGASKATVYRDFAEHGGLQHYILERRLHRAYRLLAEARAPARGHVQTVALRCGFASLAHFSRCFREKHGQSPTEVIGQWHASTDPHPGAEASSPAGAPHDADIAALRWAYTRFR